MERPSRGRVLVVTTRKRDTDVEWLTPSEVVQRLGVRRGTLDGWRFHHKGPPWERIDGRIYYKQSEFRAWLATQIRPANGRRFRLKSAVRQVPNEK